MNNSSIKEEIKKMVHGYYWEEDINCARTTLCCLGRLFDIPLNDQTLQAAIGLHGAGGFRAQCGLVEGALMFIGILLSQKGKNDSEIADSCYAFACKFKNKFSSLSCYDLRPAGFLDTDPPHVCEKITADAIYFSYGFISENL